MLTVYSKETTSFSTLGIGVLRDFLSNPLITEELNGAYTLEFQYAKDGYLSEYLIEQNIIKANGQAFRIWNIKKDMQKITVLAKHIFFDLSFNFLSDVYPKNLTAQGAFEWLLNRAAVSTNFSVTGNCTTTASGRYVRKTFIDAIFNEDNALVKRFGGELSYDNFNITVHEQRGANANFSIRYKKNLTGIDFNLDFSNVATRIVPIGFDGITIPSTYVESDKVGNYFTPLYKTYEFSDIKYDPDDEEAYHTLAEAQTALTAAANNLFTKGVDLPQISIGVNFVELSKCTEYANYSNLETVHLGDTIGVIIPELNINTTARVNKTVYDCILKRFTKLEIGSAKQSVTRSQINVENQIRKSENYLTQAQQNAENLINHPFNGNVYIDKENGVIYLMDSTSPETAQNVWKWSLGGLGFSSTGINGTYTVAILQDGRINADFITTGQLDTGVIQGYDSLLIKVDTLDREFQKEINPTDTSSGSSIILEDSAETELIDFELEGKTTQETRSGKNLFNIKSARIDSSCSSSVNGNTLTQTNSGTYARTSWLITGLTIGQQYTLSFDFTNSSGASIQAREYDSNNSSVINNGSTTTDTSGNYVSRFTATETSHYLRLYSNTLNTSNNYVVVFKNIQIESGSSATSYEEYGVMPSPDYPSELISVGYENLFNKDNANILNAKYGATITADNNERMLYIPCEPNTTYTLYHVATTPMRNSIGTTQTVPAIGVTIEDGVYSSTSPKTITTNANAKYIVWQFYAMNDTTHTLQEVLDNIQIEQGRQLHSYIPYGKYGIEVKTTGKNLFDFVGITDSSGVATLDNGIITINWDAGFNIDLSNAVSNLDTTKTYTVSFKHKGNSLYLRNKSVGSTNILQTENDTDYTSYSLTLTNISSFEFRFVRRNTTGTAYIKEFQIEQGSTATDYEPYVSNTNLITLDNPLRSIGNYKDKLYIENGMLYVDRKIGKVVLNGSEEWGKWDSQTLTDTILCGTNVIDNISNVGYVGLSNYFVNSSSSIWDTDTVAMQINSSGTNKIRIRINKTIATTSIELKTWLSTHNTEVQYVLAESYTEELGQVNMPSTYEGITYIDTTDELEPNMNITYVRDTIIANYVESHVSELKITEKGIESRVQTIEESNYGSRINAVEERTTDTEHNIEVISTNIDTTTGEVRKVTTTNGMTFDENGLNIHTNQSTFNAQHTYDGTYYRDGDEVITETTIKGFTATNLKNKGQHEYSYDDTNEVYEFIDERIEVDGEHCYATFYNGEE